MSNVAKLILKAAGKKGKTVRELAESTGYSLEHTRVNANTLLYNGELIVKDGTGTSPRNPAVYARPSKETMQTGFFTADALPEIKVRSVTV